MLSSEISIDDHSSMQCLKRKKTELSSSLVGPILNQPITVEELAEPSLIASNEPKGELHELGSRSHHDFTDIKYESADESISKQSAADNLSTFEFIQNTRLPSRIHTKQRIRLNKRTLSQVQKP